MPAEEIVIVLTKVRQAAGHASPYLTHAGAVAILMAQTIVMVQLFMQGMTVLPADQPLYMGLFALTVGMGLLILLGYAVAPFPMALFMVAHGLLNHGNPVPAWPPLFLFLPIYLGLGLRLYWRRHFPWTSLLMTVIGFGTLFYLAKPGLDTPLAWFYIFTIAGACAIILDQWIATYIALPAQPPEMDYRQDASRAQTASYSDFQSEFPAVEAQWNFNDVAGMEDLKNRLYEAGVQVIEPKEGRPARNGILLSGEPGNGKSLFAEALAGELGVPIINVTFGALASRWVNQTTEKVVAAFAAAREAEPCLLFIDEIDSVLVDRSTIQSGDSEVGRTVNTFLTELTSIRNARVLIVAATNHLDRLDPAGIREGRFDFKIEVPPPDQEAREFLLTSALENQGIQFSEEDLVRVARRWEGFSVARIRAIADQLVRDADGPVGFDDFMRSLRTVQGSLGYRMTDRDLDLTQLVFPEDQRKRLLGIADRMRHIDEVEALGGTVPTGILFHGPGGTGKTATAKALAKSAGWAFLPTTGQALMAKTAAIDELVKKAKDLRPVVVLLDEADDVFADRRTSYATTVTNKLLSVMDGAEGKVPDILFVATTNNIDAFDPAALRGGRFSEKIEFDIPDQTTLVALVERWMAAKQRNFAPEVTPTAAADLLEGLAHSSVIDALQQAVNIMVARRNSGQVLALTLNDIRAGRHALEH